MTAGLAAPGPVSRPDFAARARLRPLGFAVAVVVLASMPCQPVQAQKPERPTLSLLGLNPGGARASITDSWSKLDFSVFNPTDQDRQARILVFYVGQEDAQYGRDIWVPANSVLSTWMMIGPPPKHATQRSREIQYVLYEHTGGKDRLILPSADDVRFRSRLLFYQPRTPTTTVVVDLELPGEPAFGDLPRGESRSDEAVRFAQVFRLACELPPHIQPIGPANLPPTPDGFDGVDHVILASARLSPSSAGLLALRRWLEQGGKAWVMLDCVEPAVVAALLGDLQDFHLVDRVERNELSIQTHMVGKKDPEPLAQRHERPVDLVRVLLPEQEQVAHTVDGWPLWFTRPLGRGRITFTTLGSRAWYHPTRTVTRVPGNASLVLPYHEQPLVQMATDFLIGPPSQPFRDSSFTPLLDGAIGYTIASRSTVAAIFGGFLLAALVVGFALGKRRRLDWRGWIGPAAALGAALAFLPLGESSRRVAPATLAIGQVIEGGTGRDEAPVHGLAALYKPSPGPEAMAAHGGVFFDLDTEGLEGQARRLIRTDLDAWHLENVSLPVGVRLAPFRFTTRTGEPLAARARFGPDGVSGQVSGAKFQGLGDAVVASAWGRSLPVRLRSDGAFEVDGNNPLASGDFLAEAVLTERQQRRQDVLREFTKRPKAGRRQEQPMLFLWADPVETPIEFETAARRVGDALVALPLQLERSPDATRVTVPAAFISHLRMIDSVPTRPTLESAQASEQHLRFQLPQEILPLNLERARFSAKINASGRTVVVSGQADGKFVELTRVESPLAPIHVDLTEPRFLRLDESGGLHMKLGVSESQLSVQRGPKDAQGSEVWTLEYIELEVTGQMAAATGSATKGLSEPRP